jgi:hydrogenase maturation protein HypF
VREIHSDRTATPCAVASQGRRIEVRGTVQGVGFRPWVYRVAHETAVTGRVCNHTGGVTIEAFGTCDALESFVGRLTADAPGAAVIEEVSTAPIPFERASGFEIQESARRHDRRISIPPDLPVCADCLAELHDPSNRRAEYAFTNCTSCGPRFTIATAVPYDRGNTTMAAFRMCSDCQREYESPHDRRFHAQPNACPVCGPALWALGRDGSPVAAIDPIGAAVAQIRDGGIVALKGIGGFHLACDATSPRAVSELRVRKRRDEKPFAVMVASVAAARELAVLSEAEERLLTSPERPVVLLGRRERTVLAEEIAPLNPWVGLLLPYSPLHHLLLERVGRPLVMTSANVSDEPIAYTNADAQRRLRGIADLFLVHDREIVTRCDDSVARVIAGRPIVLRRSRGYVPRPVRLARPMTHAVLACGALLKNTFCLARGNEACLGPHIGDLENLETFTSYRDAIARLERFLDFRPEVVAHDLHPGYLSTEYALSRGGAVPIAVQHHHAHIASVMAEHGIEGRVIGLAYDGTGLGTDGTSWGGEVMVADVRTFQRVATFRPIKLAGGDAAVRYPWRAALALLDDAFGGDPPIEALKLFERLSASEVGIVRRMIQEDVNAPLAHGVGRYFDAIGAIALERPRAAYEGQVAAEWNAVAEAGEAGAYRYDVDRRAATWQLDLRGAIRDAVFELIGGEPASRISARFHNTLAEASADLVRAAARLHGRLPVVLSGGCFQNARLAEGILRKLESDFTVHLPATVPPGDGGIALGQAVIADALAATSV